MVGRIMPHKSPHIKIEDICKIVHKDHEPEELYRMALIARQYLD
jgi:hypothetical protein